MDFEGEETTLLVKNIHCKSCENVISSTLASLSPAPASVGISVSDKTVRVRHNLALSYNTIALALSHAGFEIEGRNAHKSAWGARWPFGSRSHRRRKLLHEQTCEVCRNKHKKDDHIVMEDVNMDSSEQPEFDVQFILGGMTCGSCVNVISQTLADIDGVYDVAVNLLSKSGSARVVRRNLTDVIKETIEDIGYECDIVTVVQRGAKEEPTNSRTLTMKIDGMFCMSCPKLVCDSLQTNFPSLHVHPGFELDHPLLMLTYSPSPPEITVRSYMKFVSSLSPHFSASIVPPPNLENMAHDIQSHYQRKILLRLASIILLAIPTFILGVVFTALIPQDSSLAKYWSTPILNGRVSRDTWALFFIATPVYFFGSDVFVRKAVQELWSLWRNKWASLWRRLFRFGSMDLLMALGTSIAYLTSVGLLIASAVKPANGQESVLRSTYFDSTVFLTMFLLVGRTLESLSKSKAADAVGQLSKLRPSDALVLESDGSTNRVPCEELEVGDVIKVRHGDSPTCDGKFTAIDGTEEGKMDESSITGESKVATKRDGDLIYAGTVNVGPTMTVKIDKIVGDTLLDDILDCVRAGQKYRASIEFLADVVTGYFVPVIILLALVTFSIWLSLGLTHHVSESFNSHGSAFRALTFAIAVLVVACPCGIALAAPTAAFVGSGLAAKNGIIAKGGGSAFESASNIDVVCFDKTGTLTENKVAIVDSAYSSGEMSQGVIHASVAVVEALSSHPLAQALTEHCLSKSQGRAIVGNNLEMPGMGLCAEVETEAWRGSILIGNEALMETHDATECDKINNELAQWKSHGNSVVLVATKAAETSSFHVVAGFSAADKIKLGADSVVAELQRMGIETWMITGDNEVTARVVASQIGIENVIAKVLPTEKSQQIQRLQRTAQSNRNRKVKVMMVGDGINDAGALAAADCGVALGSGAGIAVSSAHFVLISPSLKGVVTIIDLSRSVLRRIKFNFAWACLYNVVLVPIAAGAIFPTGTVLNPVWASLAMALSSISVVVSSLLLKLYRPPRFVRAA